MWLGGGGRGGTGRGKVGKKKKPRREPEVCGILGGNPMLRHRADWCEEDGVNTKEDRHIDRHTAACVVNRSNKESPGHENRLDWL